MKTGIVSYGAYIPRFRLETEEIASVWGKKASDVIRSVKVREKSVAGYDEDAVTMAYEAADAALKSSSFLPSDIDVIFVGSESHPYAVNPTSTIVAEMLGVGHDYIASDFEFACKAATTAMISIIGLIKSGVVKNGMAIGSDTAQAKPHDILEYTASSSAASFLLGGEKDGLVASLIETSSYTSDVPDFWRRDGVRFPSHGGRFTGEPAYYAHVESAAKKLFSKTDLSPSNFKYCIFHMPNGKFPRVVSKRLGFTKEQLEPSLVVDEIGNSYSASSLLGLIRVLDEAKPGDLVFMVSYGSGAGSDGMIFQVEEGVKKRKSKPSLLDQLKKNKKYISYVDYLKFIRKI